MFAPFYQFLAKLGYTHPIHPSIVHMPIGLVVGAFIMLWIAILFKRPRLAETARDCMTLAFIFMFFTLLLGYMDWQHFYAGAWLFPIKVKLGAAPVLILLTGAALWITYRFGARHKSLLLIYSLCFCLVVVLGYFGGQLVYEDKVVPAANQYKAGANLFAANCGACHPKGGNRFNPNLPLLGAHQLQDKQTFTAFIRQPRNPDGKPGIMPPFPPSRISDKQAEELYGYIVHVLKNQAGE